MSSKMNFNREKWAKTIKRLNKQFEDENRKFNKIWFNENSPLSYSEMLEKKGFWA